MSLIANLRRALKQARARKAAIAKRAFEATVPQDLLAKLGLKVSVGTSGRLPFNG